MIDRWFASVPAPGGAGRERAAIRRGIPRTVVVLTLLLALGLVVRIGAASAPDDADARNAWYGLRASSVEVLAPIPTARGGLRVTVRLDGVARRLDLVPHSVRGDAFVLLTAAADGALRQAPAPPVRTLRGTIAGVPGGVVTASLLDDGLHATVHLPNGAGRHWIEPIAPTAPGFAPSSYLVYHDADVHTDSAVLAAACGTPDQAEVDRHKALPGVPAPAPGPGPPCVAELACDADWEYVNLLGGGSAAQARIESILNTVNAQYEAQVGITHVLSALVLRTTPADPYVAQDAPTLLCEFITHWSIVRAGVPRDLAVLFTGRNLTGPTVGQAADIGDVCNVDGCCACGEFGTDGSYCLVQAEYDGALACAADLTAHELGHLWGASHCTCPSHTMNGAIPCTNDFSAASIADIVAYRDTLACLDDCTDGTGPANDDCADAAPVGNETTSFSTIDATTDGPDEPFLCTNAGDTTVAADVWFAYDAPCDGIVTVDLCGSSYDTRLAVYTACPQGPNAALACNDDFDCNGDGGVADDGFVSRVSFAAVEGAPYLLRIGGYMGATGTGTMTITCAIPPRDDPDSCIGAETVAATDVLTIDNVLATPVRNDGGPGDPELPPGSPACQWNAVPTDTHSTLWYEFVATRDTIAIATCASDGATDTILALYSGDCGALTEIACGEDECGPSGFLSRLCASGLVPGTTYRVVVGNPGSWPGSTPGAITLALASPCPDLGACCFADDTCTAVTAPQCAATGGAFAGNGTSCAPQSPCGPPPCPADLNGDGSIGFADLNLLLTAWGECPGCSEDLNGDGSVGFADLNQVLGAWGPCPPQSPLLW